MNGAFVIGSALAVAVGFTVWRFRPRRRREAGFEFVYVNQDGSVRELSPEERAYLSTEFSGGDGGRPYIKMSYRGRDGWGSQSGFIPRRLVPPRLAIAPVHPDFDARGGHLIHDLFGAYRAAGDTIVTNTDGSITCTPNPAISCEERFALIRTYELAEQRRREQLAAIDNNERSSG
jgi:hypothetical protein